MNQRYFAWVFYLLSSVFSLQAAAQLGDTQYQPTVGQHGKDVIWVPTPDDLVVRMLETAKVTSKDLVYDLGAGDGKIPIQAARQFGAKAVGIEYNPELAALARRNAQRAGVSDKVTIIHGDIFKEDFSKATVVTLYLLPELNIKLKPILLAMKPGTRVVSHSFTMGLWEPDEMISGAYGHFGYYWIVPARVEGKWRVNGLGGSPATMTLRQRFQKVDGEIVMEGKKLPIIEGRLSGAALTLRYRDTDGTEQAVKAQVDGQTLSGEAYLRTTVQLTGRRLN
ncbi:MAG: hypothetical protein RJA58_1491 [Pseudomonadota bacterium]|jgi:hypothetical protein